MNNTLADLHSHTNSSDGMQPSTENVRIAKSKGLNAIGITDHDTVAGIPAAVEEGERIGITVVPGVEISTHAGGQDIHVLGYYIDVADDTLLSRLEELRRTRDRRNEMLIERLRELGIDITMDEVREHLDTVKALDETIGRPHIANALVKKGVVSSMQQAFEMYLGKGAPAYVSPERIHPRQAIDWIHEAGGTAVLAHPGLYDDDALVAELIDYGLDGIEAYHSEHSPETEAKYARLAESNGLLITAGSDFHGEREGIVYHAQIGARTIDAAVLDGLMRRRGGHHEN